MGRLIGTTTQYSFLANQTFTNTYTYDAASNRTSLTAPDGSVTTYGYDSLNRLNGLANSWAGTFGFGFDALSRRTSLMRPNGVNTSYTYDSVSHLLSVFNQTGNTVPDGASYTYDAAGNHLLPVLHLLACLTVSLAGIQSGWQYLTMVDAPASVLVIAVIYSFDHPLVVFGVIGTLWWYVVSLAIAFCWIRVSVALRNRRTPPKEASHPSV
jgi:YD repeat-containing protein